MYLGKADVNTYDKGAVREFLVTNSSGSYGSSTVIGANTRSEHGLLAVREEEGARHTILVSKLEETLYALGKKYQLSTNRYKDLVFPDGYRYVQEYQGTPYPTFTFVIHSIFLKKSVIMPRDGDHTVIKYELAASPSEITLDIRPLFAHRSAAALLGAGERPEFTSDHSKERTLLVSGRGHTSCFSCMSRSSSYSWQSKPMWFEDIVYERNGTPDDPKTDCLWSPGYGTVKMKEGDTVYVVLSRKQLDCTIGDLETCERDVASRLDQAMQAAGIKSSNTIIRDMLQGASHLVVDGRGAAPMIFSGFPSVENRARDTFISLPGLTLAVGRADTAKEIIKSWLTKARECGWVVPAKIESSGRPKIGDIDAGLWLLYVLDKYSNEVSFDLALEEYDGIKSIAERYISGSDDLGAAMDQDTCLIRYTRPENASHWMSGDVLGEPLVDRKGCLVEVCALWYNALAFIKEAASKKGDSESASRYGEMMERAAASFQKMFFNEANGYLYDWVDPTDGKHDDAIRPNALLAVSLPHPVVTGETAEKIFAVCWNELYTTYGLRTLDPHHDKFKGRSEGRDDQKKKARLRGMAWPWLLGQFVTAYMRSKNAKPDVAWSFLRPFSSHLRRGCLGGVAEYFDGMMPYLPNGDVLSAVSLGELLRVMHEDLQLQ